MLHTLNNEKKRSWQIQPKLLFQIRNKVQFRISTKFEIYLYSHEIVAHRR